MVDTERAIRAAVAERDFFAMMVMHAPLALVTFGADGVVTTWNRTAERFLGRTAERAVGKRVSEVFPQGLLDEMAEMERTALRTVPKVTDHQFVLQLADGRDIPCEIDYGKITDESDQKILAIRDVTQRKQAEKRISEFYSIVSHEIRSPLTSVRAALGLIAGGVADPAEAEELIDVAIESTDRVVRLLNDMLDFQKAEAGKMVLHPRSIVIEELINRTIDAHTSVADQSGITLRHDIRSGTPSCITADPDRLTQVLTNLISNAIKFSPPGTEVIIRTNRGTTDNTIRFEVEDTGPGISAEDLPKLFQKFQQLDSTDSRQKQGTGLGLAISKSLVEQHGGHIGVQTHPNQGSTFWFELPDG